MFKLSRQMISYRCSNYNVYLRGLAYFKSGAVTELTGDAGNRYFQAVVKGTQPYTVQVFFDKRGEVDKTSCDCEAFDGFPGYCKHIAAVLMAIASFKPLGSWSTEERIVEEMLNAFAGQAAGDSYKEVCLEVTVRLHIPRFNYEGTKGAVSLKVGEEKPYVVKDINQFISAVRRREPLYFGRRFTYNPAVHRFSPADHAVLDYFSQLQEAGELNDAAYFWPPLKGREIQLGSGLLRRLLLRLKGRSFNLVLDRRELRNVTIDETEPSLQFLLQGGAEALVLSLEQEKEIIPLTGEYDFILLGEKIYHLSGTGRASLPPVLRALTCKGDSALQLKGNQVRRFVSEALPALEKAAALEVAPALQERFYRPPLETRVYLDYEAGSVNARLEFTYGEITVNPFAPGEPPAGGGRILVRDTLQEQQVLQLFERGDFKVKGGIMHLEEEEQIWRFIHEILPELQGRAAVFYSDRFRQAGVRRAPRFSGRAGIDWKLDLLELDLELEGVDREELERIWLSIREKRKYYRLRDGSILPLEGEGVVQLARLAEALDLQPSDLRRGTVKLHKRQALQLDQLVRDQGLAAVKLGGDVEALVRQIRHPEETDCPVPAPLEETLRNYQKTGFKWLKSLARCGFGGILADDMGLGKTVQAIALLLSERQESAQPLPPALVVAPASVIYNWEAELARFAPALKTMVVAGMKPERRKLLARADRADVLITSYPLLRQDGAEYAALSFSSCIFDEAQNLKNPHTQTAQCARRLKAKRRFALTGTPIENSLTELWSIFQCIMPGYLSSHQKFMQRYGGTATGNDSLPGRDRTAALAAKVRPFILRRLKEEVLAELPPKIEHRLLSELTREQKKLYLGYLARLRDEAGRHLREGELERNRIKILAGLTRLRQICCHPSLFVENYHGESAKLLQLQELLREAVDGGHRILLFSQFTQMLQLIRAMLEHEGYRYLYLDGAVKTGERLELVKAFNEGDAPLFLASLKAGGTGLNLTGADIVIQYDLWWNPAVEEQAAGRAHRLGQEKVVQVIRLLARDTIEEKIYELQQKKKELIDKVIRPGETFLAAMSEEDIREILELT